ncbi:hypothetical protein C2845_PM09G16780 [Panicum miliaceum]|uniref:Uncharacterized protein n=1 Tax=Panicum miliaceum TaxID=4540 RepID=A0A3L6RZ06_PANMI|nr:hypothetical protein C2845_PM09G16780 [Panicum miliaceum]
MRSLDVPPYTQFNMVGSSQISCPPMNGQPSQGLSIDNNPCSQNSPSLKSHRAAKKKNVARRGTAFTKEEDLRHF